jgi:hypothetical protein
MTLVLRNIILQRKSLSFNHLSLNGLMPLVIRSVDDLYRTLCRKFLRIIISSQFEYKIAIPRRRISYIDPVMVGIPHARTSVSRRVPGFKNATGDRSGGTSFFGFSEVSLTFLRAAKSSSNRTAVLCGNTAYCSLVCERPGSCYRRAVFIGDDLAAHGSPCSSPPHREGAILGGVRRRPLPATLESIDKHQYCGYATRSKSFLFRPCFSAQWTALNSRWTHRHLGGVAQRLHV